MRKIIYSPTLGAPVTFLFLFLSCKTPGYSFTQVELELLRQKLCDVLEIQR